MLNIGQADNRSTPTTHQLAVLFPFLSLNLPQSFCCVLFFSKAVLQLQPFIRIIPALITESCVFEVIKPSVMKPKISDILYCGSFALLESIHHFEETSFLSLFAPGGESGKERGQF